MILKWYESLSLLVTVFGIIVTLFVFYYDRSINKKKFIIITSGEFQGEVEFLRMGKENYGAVWGKLILLKFILKKKKHTNILDIAENMRVLADKIGISIKNSTPLPANSTIKDDFKKYEKLFNGHIEKLSK